MYASVDSGPMNLILFSGLQLIAIIIYLISTLFQIGPVRAHSHWLLCPFDVSLLFVEYFLTFWHSKMLQAHFVLSLSSPSNQPFLQGALVPCWRMLFRSKELGTRWAHCSQNTLVLGPLSGQN